MRQKWTAQRRYYNFCQRRRMALMSVFDLVHGVFRCHKMALAVHPFPAPLVAIETRACDVKFAIAYYGGGRQVL